ncbi:hypothetical protein DFJ58DRAFT_198756 [Suillus subalutaceus]|uniref:uncharacterized protein n=1 Tax=Suillus subalutaceus TaxID=48586 RepID=UPI001B8736F0|nr:uncharacterized protein DFJ58DRAFT_198756 [Suillus subalutaceus]KAG1835915.1 hypothetical protein DFJ58DRAFT_198756 [Suillus subalutaceus]
MTWFSLSSLYITRLLSVDVVDSEDPAIPEWNSSTRRKQFGQPLKAFPLLRHLISRLFSAKAQVSNSEILLINAKPVAIQPSSVTSLYMGPTLSPTQTPNHGMEWNTSESTSTWKQISHHLTGTPFTSTLSDSQVGLGFRRLSDRRTFITFQHSALWTSCVTMDNKRILSGCQDKMILDWAVPKGTFPEKPASTVCSR